MKLPSVVLGLAASVSLLGCGGAGDGGGESIAARTQADTGDAQFVFDGTWGYHGEGTRTPGTVGTIVYDTSRLPSCRATEDGVAAWGITAFISADGGDAIQVQLPSETGVVSAPFEIPYASGLAFWFEAQDDSGCVQWDSNYGANFPFSVEDETGTIIHFRDGFTTQIDGTLNAGQDVTIDYDFRRLPECRETSGADPAWAITMFSQIDGGTATSADLDQTVDGYRFASPGTISLPASASTLTLWFENDDIYGCNAWDSDYGQNYTFSIQ
jgi:Family of unknown function (DUF6209)